MNASSASVLLLVDGYNMIGAWKTLKSGSNCGSIFSDRSHLEASRLRLVRDLIDYSAFQGYTTQVVFDAQQRDCPGNCEQMSAQLTIYFTDFGQTATSNDTVLWLGMTTRLCPSGLLLLPLIGLTN
jgi:uncharacterized protein